MMIMIMMMMMMIIIIIIMMMMIMMMIMIIVIIVMALKGAIPDVLQSRHCAVNCLQRVRSSGQSAIVCKSRATHRASSKCNMCLRAACQTCFKIIRLEPRVPSLRRGSKH